MDKPEIGESCNGCGLCCQVQVCSTGSLALGLVEAYGERAAGPCPALEQDGEGWACGLVRRPKHYLPGNPRGVTVLREAAKLLIGAGIGCDEAGDEPDLVAQPKLDVLRARCLAHHSQADFNRAVRVLFDGR